jgi:hypothetical protein
MIGEGGAESIEYASCYASGSQWGRRVHRESISNASQRNRDPRSGGLLVLNSHLSKLLSVASGPLGDDELPLESADQASAAVYDLLRHRNGFYAFGSALHVFGYGGKSVPGRSLQQWNSKAGWRALYPGIASHGLLFAEDVLGCQFLLDNQGVHTFDPETSDIEIVATTITAWVGLMVQDYNRMTGYPLAHEWQQSQGGLKMGERLMPKLPLVLGGAFSVGNMYSLDAEDGMRLRSDLARQIRDLAEGARIEYKIVE